MYNVGETEETGGKAQAGRHKEARTRSRIKKPGEEKERTLGRKREKSVYQRGRKHVRKMEARTG